MQVTTIGLDIAKHVFQVHGVDARGKVVLRKRLARGRVLAHPGLALRRHDPQLGEMPALRAAPEGRMDGRSQDRPARCFEKALARRAASMDGPIEQ